MTTNEQLKALAEAAKNANSLSAKEYRAFNTYATPERILALIAENERLAHSRKDAEPVAEVNSAHGDPERFGERRVDVLLSDKAMLKVPYGTKLYPHPPEADKLLQQALEYARLMKLYGPAMGYGNTTIDDHIAAPRTYLEGKK